MPGMRTTLELRRATEARDRYGSVSRTWIGQRNLRGLLAQLSGSEQKAQDKATVYATHRFILAVPPGLAVTEKDEMWMGARRFKVVLVRNPDSRGRTLLVDLLEQGGETK